MVLAIAAHFGWEARRMDAQTAFLYADIEEEVFVEEPPGFETQDKDGDPLVMKLGKRLYGLAQSPGNCMFTMDPVLIAIGFEPQVQHLRVHLPAQRSHHPPHTLRGQSSHCRCQHRSDRDDQEEAGGQVQDEGHGRRIARVGHVGYARP